MRHRKKLNHLGRTSSHRKAMLANMASSLILHKRITTTTAKAKALRVFVEPIITRAKSDSTHSRRLAFKYLKNKYAVSELFREVATKIADRAGGYTRILKTGNRLGDNADMSIIELVDYNENMLAAAEETKKKAKRTRRRGGKKKSAAETAQTETTQTAEPVESDQNETEEAAVTDQKKTEETVETDQQQESADVKEDTAEQEESVETKDESDKQEGSAGDDQEKESRKGSGKGEDISQTKSEDKDKGDDEKGEGEKES